MSGRKSRIKGAVWERKLVRLFREAMPEADVKRGLQYRSGDETCDVDVSPFWIEAKAHNRTNIKAALRQAMETAPQGRLPIAVCKDDYKQPIAAMLLDDFLELIEQWWIGQRR